MVTANRCWADSDQQFHCTSRLVTTHSLERLQNSVSCEIKAPVRASAVGTPSPLLRALPAGDSLFAASAPWSLSLAAPADPAPWPGCWPVLAACAPPPPLPHPALVGHAPASPQPRLSCHTPTAEFTPRLHMSHSDR
eukprot:1195105-Prorocentrum_minimum.AAC.2